jgi:hypothetical protein
MPDRLHTTHVSHEAAEPAAPAAPGPRLGCGVVLANIEACAGSRASAVMRSRVASRAWPAPKGFLGWVGSRAVSRVTAGLVGSLLVLSSGCATTDPPKKDEGPITASAPKVTSVEVAEIEISGSGEDRFVSCPPAGELGQAWIPPLPAWSGQSDAIARETNAPAASTNGNVAATPSATASTSPTATSSSSGNADGARAEAAAASRLATQSAITETFPDFRTCHYKGLRVDPTQDGHVAIVARVGASGNVEKVEEFGACNLSSDVITCMRASAGRLRFDPPPGGSMTVTIPAYFASLQGYKSNQATRNDAYTAAAYITIEQARPQLHACEAAARKGNKGIEASATLLMTLDAGGHVSSIQVDPWAGNQELLACGAQTFQSLTFDPPPAGRGSVLARVVFNPRAGSR